MALLEIINEAIIINDSILFIKHYILINELLAND